ncbi:MAG: ATP-binding cassette domain-containing protein [Anaerohalosphaeraceae bacterium]
MNTIRFSIRKHIPFTRTITDRMRQVMNIFGLTLFRLRKQAFNHTLDIELGSGDICYITGRSGTGKSILLNALYAHVPERDRLRLNDIPLEADQSLIDSIGRVNDSLFETLDILAAAGLSDVLAMLSRPQDLSTGEIYRYRLARAILSGKRFIFADEFMASVDCLTAAVVSRRLRDIARRTGGIFIFAGVRSDLIVDLAPDIIVVKHPAGLTDIIYRDPARQQKTSSPRESYAHVS